MALGSKGGQSGQLFQLTDEEITTLLADSEFMFDYRDAARIVFLAWGWDLAKSAPVENPDPDQKWSNWPIRAYKFLVSFEKLQQADFRASALQFVAWLIKNNEKITSMGKKELLTYFEENNPFEKIGENNSEVKTKNKKNLKS